MTFDNVGKRTWLKGGDSINSSYYSFFLVFLASIMVSNTA